MKKVKLMLVSLSILAVVGAALAFKARVNPQICTAPTVNGTCPANYFCPTPKKVQPGGPSDFICTTPTIANGSDLCHVTPLETVKCGIISVNSTPE